MSLSKKQRANKCARKFLAACADEHAREAQRNGERLRAELLANPPAWDKYGHQRAEWARARGLAGWRA